MEDAFVDLSVLETEPAEEYHSKAADFLSSHQIMDFMKCPWLHFKKRSGLIPDKDSPAYLIGRAAHSRILEGRDVYEASFAMGGPINPKKADEERAIAEKARRRAESEAGRLRNLNNPKHQRKRKRQAKKRRRKKKK
jgi:hypothetical protein